MRDEIERRSTRWRQQRWLMDAVVQTIGVEWDQARLAHYSRPGGGDAAADFRAAGARMKKFSDIHREFRAAAKRRQGKAEAYEAADRLVAARESYIAASLLWAAARWPLYEVDDKYRDYESNMIACYDKYIAYAPRPIERVEIPFGDKTIPGLLHLPRAPEDGERFPCILNIGGMDGCKENVVAMYGDKALERGIAVLALDGPGQGECPARGIFVTATNHREAGIAAVDFVAQHPAIDADRIVLRCTSFGTYYGTQAAAGLGDRIKGISTAFIVHEPGCSTIFNAASPTFRMRYMFMAGHTDEDAFDAYIKDYDLRNVAGDVRCPYLIIAGEDDELSPIEYTYDLYERLKSPKKLVVYEGGKHNLGAASSVTQGENAPNLIADWIQDRIEGKPMSDEHILVDMYGQSQPR